MLRQSVAPLNEHNAEPVMVEVHVCDKAWRCHECKARFCASCSGYSSDVVRSHELCYASQPAVPLPVYVYCTRCLGGMDFALGNSYFVEQYQGRGHDALRFIADQLRQVQRLCELFALPGCPFDWKPVAADGACAVVSVSMVLGMEPVALCKALAAFVSETNWTERHPELFVADTDPAYDEGSNGNEPATQFRRCWASVACSKSQASCLNPIRDLWDSSVGDAVLALLGDCLFERCGGRVLVIYELARDHSQLEEKAVYPQPEPRAELRVCILRWNIVCPTLMPCAGGGAATHR